MSTTSNPAENIHAEGCTITGLHKSYGDVEVLKGIDLEVEPGQVVCLIGPSGSGKSTLLRCVNLLEQPNAGTITVAGYDATDPDVEINSLRRHVGMVFQAFNLFPHLTVVDNCTISQRRVLRRGKAEAEKVAREKLTQVGLAELADRYPDQLSGGQQQRVAIARALAMDPNLMLFDEPTSALDPETVGDVLLVMRSLAEAGMTMVVVTHEMGFARKAGNRVVFMADGEIVEVADPEEFFTNPQSARAQDFLSKILTN